MADPHIRGHLSEGEIACLIPSSSCPDLSAHPDQSWRCPLAWGRSESRGTPRAAHCSHRNN